MAWPAGIDTRLDGRRVWRLAVCSFVLAGLTGVMLRLVPLVGLPGGLRFGDVRHAHSHLMYFGWATPMLMTLIGGHVQARSPSSAGGAAPIAAVTVLAAWTTYLPFLLAGYAPLELGGAVLPLSVATAGLNGLAWWWFAMWYRTVCRSQERALPLQLFDGAVGLLVVASIGALLRGVVDAVGLTSRFARQAPIHAFLDMFSDGWFLLAVLGLAWSALRPRVAVPRLLVPAVVVGLLPVFLLTLPVSIVPVPVRIGAAILSVGGLAGLGWLLATLWLASTGLPGWRTVLVFLGIRIVGGVVLLHPGWTDWALDAGLRVLHLHVGGLGLLTAAVVTASAEVGLLPARRAAQWRGAIIAVVASILAVTGMWPPGLRGPWAQVAVAATAVLPVLVAARALLDRPSPVVAD